MPPFDAAVRSPLDKVRRNNLVRLTDTCDTYILNNATGIGLEYLSHDARYTGTDITPSMLKRAE